MNDIVYAVYYRGSHQKSYLIMTTDEARAKEVADSAQGFPMEKWENGKIVDKCYYHGGK